MGKCRKSSSQCIRQQDADEYPCQICQKVYYHKNALRNHIFGRHSEIEVQAIYQCSIEKFMGNRQLQRLRAPLMSAIIKQKFTQYADSLLSDKQPFRTSELDYTFSILVDICPLNQQKRKNIYQKKRELLLKLAVESDL
jgi:hypothetical protein